VDLAAQVEDCQARYGAERQQDPPGGVVGQRPSMSATRPNRTAPTAEASNVAELTHETWFVERCHSGFSSATTMPITNRS
jgi:hypothetical protein